MHLILSYILASLSMSSTRKATWPSIWWLTRSSRVWGIPWCCIPVSAPSGGACRHQSRPVSVINQTQISAWSLCTTLLNMLMWCLVQTIKISPVCSSWICCKMHVMLDLLPSQYIFCQWTTSKHQVKLTGLSNVN